MKVNKLYTWPLLFLFLSCAAEAAEVQLLRPKKENRVSVLKFESKSIDVGLKNRRKKNSPWLISIEGNVTEKAWSIIINHKPRNHTDDPQHFQFDLEATKKRIPLKIVAVHKNGETQSEKAFITFVDWREAQKEKRFLLSLKNLKRKNQLSTSLGYTFISFHEKNVDASVHALSVKVADRYTLPETNWDIAGNFYLNLLPVSTTGTEKTIRFFGANARVGYTLPYIKQPWQLSILTGLSYSTMLTSGKTLGYRHLLYPQVYPTLSRRFQNGHSVHYYFKYVSIGKNWLAPSFSSREIGTGISYNIPITKKDKSITFNLNLSSLNIPNLKNIKVNTISMSVGYGFKAFN